MPRKKISPFDSYQVGVKKKYNFTKLPAWTQEYIAWLETRQEGTDENVADLLKDLTRFHRRDAFLCGIIFKLIGTTPDGPGWPDKAKELGLPVE